ncbi:hypothetical protein ACFO0M_02995 [Micromonospora mangrovi]|uniref:Uncharacterized protein n=2 Tax=Micromonospora TaxID=1873 RepID=A0AAU7M0K8_9ACTN
MLPAPRTRDEAHLYLDLHGCPQCTSPEVSWSESLVDRDGVLARRYHGDCAQCGLPREFVFALPDRPTPPRPGAAVTFGAADDTSVLLDAGQWVEIADMMALAAGLPDVAEEEAGHWRAVAVACLDEALKFLPAGDGTPPDTAFWSDAGRRLRDRAPERFQRADLVARRATLAGHR